MPKRKKDLAYLDNLRFEIDGETYSLRRFSFRDIHPLTAIFGDPKTMADLPKLFTHSQIEDRVVRNFQRYLQFGIGQMAIVRDSDQRVIGDAGIRQALIAENLENQFEIVLHHEFWQKGIGSQVGQVILALLPLLDLERVACHFPVRQAAAQALAEKLGFTRETRYRNARHRDEEYWVYSRTQ